ncbi:antitermination protein Q [Escherichia coli DEC1A]|nr:antitermination protein Q [Escherichia coli DEC1A]
MLLGYFKIENKKQMDSNVDICEILDDWGLGLWLVIVLLIGRK